MSPKVAPESPLSSHIFFRLASIRPKRPEKHVEGFAVEGAPMEALQSFHDGLAGTPSRKFAEDSQIWATFFNQPFGYHVRPIRIEKQGFEIRFVYRFVTYGAALTQKVHFALIPLGNLPPGTYRVIPIQEATPDDKPDSTGGRFIIVDDATVKKFVCSAYTFNVVASGSETH